jgi:hypothetical protein
MSGEGVNVSTYEVQIEAGLAVELSEAIDDGQTDYDLLFPVDLACLKAILIAADRDVTVEVNHPAGTSTAADQTIELKANQPVLWIEDDPVECPINQTIAMLYVTNASGAAANFKAIAMFDPSP